MGDSLVKDPELAIACFQKAVEVHPKNRHFHDRLANFLKGQRRLDEAVAAYRKIVELDTKDAGTQTQFGHFLWECDKQDETTAAYRAADELAPPGTMRLAVLDAWFGRTKELAAARRRMIEYAKVTREALGDSHNAILVCCLDGAMDAADL